MNSLGYINVHAYESTARIPLKDVAISVTAADGTAIALRLTDRSGRVEPIAIPVPELSESLTPDPLELPFTQVDLYARAKGYQQIVSRNLQVFPGITTDQELEMIPLAEMPGAWDRTVLYDTPPQGL